MKNFCFAKKISACAAAAACALAFSSGCFLFKDDKLSTPEPERMGSIYSWAEVEGANKYRVSTGGKNVYTTETALRILNPDDGGKLTVTAVNDEGETQLKSEAAVIELQPVKKGDKSYKEYDVTSGNKIIIPDAVEKAVLKSDGKDRGNEILVQKRATPLIIELYDVYCYNFRVEESEHADKNACVTVRSLGEKKNYIRGVRGADGKNGADGSGVAAGGNGANGGTGGTAGVFGYVIFEGDKELTFYGGTGGSGGTGGKPGNLQSIGGDGGNGGDGGCGLSVACAYDFLGGSLLVCEGGGGGYKGYGGAGKWIPLVGYDNGEDGKDGKSGVDFKGEKITKEYLSVEIKPADEYAPDGSGDGAGDSAVFGTYKFYYATNGEETYFVGDEMPGGDGALTAEYMTFTFNADGTFTSSLNGEAAENAGTWEIGGNLMVLDNGSGDIIKAYVKGDDIEITKGNITIVLRKG